MKALILLTLLINLFFTVKTYITMGNMDTRVEGDVNSLKDSLTTIAAKLDSIANDPANTLSEQSASDLDAVTTAFKTLADSLTPAAE